MSMLNYEKIILLLVANFFFCYSNAKDIPNDFPPEYSNCSCQWTDWMNSDSPANDEVDDETWRSLRSRGYAVCEKPVAIQCFSETDSLLVDPERNIDVTCDVDIGLKCQFFCSDYKVRAACCYCPPQSIGPLFQITSEHNGGCLAANIGSGTDPGVISLNNTCSSDDRGQLWSWVSQSQIKSENLGRCITVVNDTDGSLVKVADCDSADRKQEWTYDRISKSLSSGIGYLSSFTGRYVTSESKSRWMGQVKIGKLDLTMLKGMPCDSEPTPPAHGSVTCNSGTYQGSVCQFSCDAGFALPSNHPYTVVCMRNQKYNGSTPSCTRITCQALTTPAHGKVDCSDRYNQNSVCRYTCDYGYKLRGKPELVCIASDKWNNAAPSCQRIVCAPDLTSQSLEHGAVICNDSSFLNSRCSFQCNAGYQLDGPAMRSCGDDGEWSASSPTCQKVQCPTIVTPSNAIMTCSDDFWYLSTCRFSCLTGYTLVGSDANTCQSDMSWAGEPPRCQRKICSRLEVPQNGRFTCSDGNFFSSTCTYQCSEGFRLSHNYSLNCTGDGWDRGAPVCQQITCPRVFEPANGNLTCSKGELYGSKCSFSCDKLYLLEGPKVLSCGETGWSSTAPSCSKIKCLPYTSPTNGNTQCIPNFEVESVCITTCNEGYALEPPIIFPKCKENGQWSGDPQRCKKIRCRSLSLLNGRVACSDENNFNSKCRFSCNGGYNLYGSPETTCEANGWSQQVPSCGRVLCLPQVAHPINGQVECETEGVLSCTFSCNRGFKLKGNNHTQCQSDGKWSNPNPPTCRRVTCAAGVVTPTNGRVDCSNRAMFGSVCNYTCDRGYHLKGEKLIKCADNGEWDAPIPTCERVSCPSQGPPNHGEVHCTDHNFFSSTCTFTCATGYERIGPETSQCQLDKTWSSTAPYCEKITCSPGFSNPSNGRVTCTDLINHGSVCSFKCNDGFRLEGTAATKCGNSGWSVRSAPSCKKITCDLALTPFEGGSESCDHSNNFQSVCSYTCNEGYQLAGASMRECNRDGNWSNSRPSCRAIECPPIKISNAQVTCSTGWRFGSECVFACSSGYRRAGSEKVSCTLSKSWNPANIPVCELVAPIPPTINPSSTRISTVTSKVETLTPLVNSRGDSVSINTTTPAIQLQVSSTARTVDSKAIDEGFPIIPIIAGAVVFVLILIGIVIFLLLKRRRKPHSSRASYKDRSNDSQLQRLLPNGSSSRKFAPILVERLESEFSRKHADDDKLFREEFANLPEAHGSREQGGKLINKEKNRYTNIIPYDHSRVVLPRSDNSDSDYINASFVDGYKHKGKFISAQGPKDCTIGDFWRMIWDQNVSTIIMVTNLQEGKEIKCAQYWPQYGKTTYEDLEICFTVENHLVDYTVRKFTIQQVSDEGTLRMRRNLVQYHFTSWPDFGVPKSPSGMLKFLRKIKHGSPTGYGAIVVHCSAGVGRTGTFICLDAMLDMMTREGKIDVFGFVSQMRGQRPEMVQTEQQYIFIYQALLEHHLYGDTEVDVADLNSYIDELNKRMPGNVTGMEHDFKKLTTIPIQKEQMRAGNHPANMRKNRVLLILPYDWNRVILYVKPGVENSDYINASHVDGYRQKDAYIATQGPLPHTVEDFWRLVWETESASIVMLTELVERGQTKCEQYWPDSGVMIYGDLSVELNNENELDNYTTRDFVVTSLVSGGGRKQLVRQFHYHAWPENGPPVSGYSMISLVEQVQKQQQTSGNHPIVVHCSAGAGRTGSFCALSTALEQVKAEGVLDMFQIVKCLRMQRPHMVQNLEQYEFCFRAVQEYVDSMSEYYNFK